MNSDAGLSEKSADKKKGGWLTIEHVLDLVVAVGQSLLLIDLAQALGLKLSLERLLRVLEFLLLRLVLVSLVSQLLGQAVALLPHPAALLLLGMQRGLRFAQALLQVGIGSYGRPKKKRQSTR